MKYIFSIMMMFIAYNGFSQNSEGDKTRSVTTFPNGDEAITIIEKTDTNVIQLTRSDESNAYDMLDLSKHEAMHRSTKKKGIIRTDSSDKFNEGYTSKSQGRKEIIDKEEEEPNTSGA